MPEEGAGFGLYIHWPFCEAKCPYCDFNSHVAAKIDQKRWADALSLEISRVAGRLAEAGQRPVVTSVFFGGGTPSTMSGETVAAIISTVKAHWRVAPDVEISLEANPTSSEAAKFTAFAEAGVNRLSLGVQALNDRDLKRLGRLHDTKDAIAAFSIARSCFQMVSFDLICARQDQTLRQWERELDEALSMAVDHISLYQLTIEPGTAFAKRQQSGKLAGLPDEDLGVTLYETTIKKCGKAGLELYEVSNFARPGAECRHNLLYWSGGDYAGIGPGAHGRLTLGDKRVATEQESLPGKWLNLSEKTPGSQEHETEIPIEEQYVEYVLMGLRKRAGLDLKKLREFGSIGESGVVRAQPLEEYGLLETVDGRLRATPPGRLLLDSITAELVSG